MGIRTQSHQLSSGLYVSGRPETLPKDRRTPISSLHVPYTGGDVTNSPDLLKMLDIPQDSPRAGSGPNSGSLTRKSTSSGPFPLHPTGLITSGSLTSSGERPGPGPVVGPGQPKKGGYGAGVTDVGAEERFGVRVSKAAIWGFVVAAAAGLLVGVFLTVAVNKGVILVAVGAVLVAVAGVVGWSLGWRRKAVLEFVSKYGDSELRGAVDGQFVKITGVVTCGSISLESSFQKIPRCVYISTELYEYRFFSWGCTHSERYATDFYLSDFQTGLRALVKAGHGSKISPFVKPSTVANVTKEKQKWPPNFLQWLDDRKLSSDDRAMCLKEGYVKEGNTVSIMGVVKRHDNVLMIVPPSEPVSTGFQWLRCLLPMYIEGLILACDDDQNSDVIPV